MNWLKKWSYIILLAGTGIVYLTCVDHWQVYGQSLQQVKAWYEELKTASLTEGGSAADGENAIAAADGPAEGTPPEQPAGEGVPVSEEDTSSGNPADPIGEEPSGNPADPIGEDLSGNPADPSGADPSNPADPSGENPPGSPVEASEGGETEPGENENPAGELPPEGGENPPAEPVYTAVEDDYFADALFIGDSRTVGMRDYGGLEEISTFYASTGLTIYKMFGAEIVSVPGEKRNITVEEALQQNTFAKIYLMIGINEMGTGTVDSFIETYAEAVAHLQELQPNAIIYLQGIIKVTTARSEKGDYINNEGIVARNEGIAGLADNEKVFYLDVNPLICDETGGMVADYTFDGVHLKAKYIEIWKDYLKSHAISS